MQEDLLQCPNCNSTNIEAKEQGFDKETAAVGGLLFGGLGMLVAGYKNRKAVIIHCLDCKHQTNHNRALGTDYKAFKTEFYALYTQSKYQDASAYYANYLNEPGENAENIHDIYIRFRSEDKKSQLITILFVVFIVLLLATLFFTY